MRPGLSSKEAARKNIAAKTEKQVNKRNNIKPKKVIEHEHRLEGLQKSITSENKGFALLQKMGYKPGMTIGKKGVCKYIDRQFHVKPS